MDDQGHPSMFHEAVTESMADGQSGISMILKACWFQLVEQVGHA